jgi:hypothetical protein
MQKALRLRPEGLFSLSCIPVRKNKSERPKPELLTIRLPAVPQGTVVRHRFVPRNGCLFVRHPEVVESMSPLFVSAQPLAGYEWSTAMPLRSTCRCTLCELEIRMLRNLAFTEKDIFSDPGTPLPLRNYSNTADLLLPLRSSPANSTSDQLLGECLKIHIAQPVFIETMLILVFVPMLHRAVRRVLLFQPALAEEDVTQQALSALLQFLRSDEMQTRRTHFAFAISRAVKRNLFAWAQREGMHDALKLKSDILASLIIEDSFESYAQLGHFLHRCVMKGDLTNAELDLLIHYKLEANHGEDFDNSNGHSSNALRQRLKRLLAKLRRLAQ